MRKVVIGLLGFGTIGSGVVKILQEQGTNISQKTGIDLHLKKIADINIVSPQCAEVSADILTTNANEIIEDPEIDIIIELIGGIEPAKTFILKSIVNKKHIVTANKALLANNGDEVFKAGQYAGIDIGFEASIAGAIPVIKTIREALVANEIESILGIINGTSNYILSKMTDEGSTFVDAIAEAQIKGYAEADPSFDVDGIDAKHKLTVLLSLAYGQRVEQEEIYCEGISQITPEDIKFTAELGYRVKLLAIAIKRKSGVEARVHPTLVPVLHPISHVDGNYNALHIIGSASSAVFLHGQGAGMMPTASAVVSDVVDIARNIVFNASGRMPFRCPDESRIRSLKIVPMEDVYTKYYIRFMALDRPGVLSKISGILGKKNISIASVIQKGRMYDGSAVPLVMLTHNSKESNIRTALSQINKLDVIARDASLIRIEEGQG